MDQSAIYSEANVIEALAHGKWNFIPTPCLAPTDAKPGSREKVEVLALRVLGGFDLWHPADEKVLDKKNDSICKTEIRKKSYPNHQTIDTGRAWCD
jgi:hypothetical protein